MGEGSTAPVHLLGHLCADHLVWFPEAHCGYFPVREAEKVYDAAYWRKYQEMGRTEMGRRLTAARVALVARHYNGPLVDVGIGAGSFIDARPGTYGFDINAQAIEWLNTRDIWWNPRIRPCRAAAFWDSLEHIHDFPAMLANVTEWVFVSMPVFTGPGHVLRSKHFRRDEHYWYFTTDGFTRIMALLGWERAEVNNDEILIGREDIASFAFRRCGA